MTDTPQWERQPSDTPKSYEAFCIYRDMGVNRSLRNVAQQLDKSLTLIFRWNDAHDWQKRVVVYDDSVDKQRSERRLHKRIEVENHTLSDYDFMRKAIDKRIEGFEATNFQGKAHEYETLLALMKHADDYVRRSLGMPDKIVESKTEHSGPGGKPIEQRVEHTIKSKDMTDDELARIAGRGRNGATEQA